MSTQIETTCVQGATIRNAEPRQIPIYQNTTWKYDSSEFMGKLFDLEESGYFYTRLQNPTNDAVAAKIADLRVVLPLSLPLPDRLPTSMQSSISAKQVIMLWRLLLFTEEPLTSWLLPSKSLALTALSLTPMLALKKLQLPSVLIQRYFSQRPSQTQPW